MSRNPTPDLQDPLWSIRDQLEAVVLALDCLDLRPDGPFKFDGRPTTWDRSRAASWVRVINQRVYNLASEPQALQEDFERTFPKVTGQWRSACAPESVAGAKNALRALRDQIVDYFDIPADGHL